MSEKVGTQEILQASNVIDLGSIVEIHYMDDPIDETVTIQLIGWKGEGNTGDARVTIRSDEPFGRQLLGKSVGETVSFQAPKSDVVVEVEIMSIRRPLP